MNIIGHEPRKISLASATRLSLVLGTRGFPSRDYSWFGFIGNVSSRLFYALVLRSNFNAKKNSISEPINLKGFVKDLKFWKRAEM